LGVNTSPLGPSSEYPGPSPYQAASSGCRERRCLLKDCEQSFQPRHPLSRYCGEGCVQAARRWSQWRANQRYRASDQGRCRRREQSRRWRMQARQRDSVTQAAGEGYQESMSGEKFSCSRPGCYEQFCRTRRSPLQKFCSFLCRRALWRVLQRESRWRRRCLGRRAINDRPARQQGP